MNDGANIREVFSSIQGEGYLAGRRQIFIRFSDCNLACRYCDTEFEEADSCRVEMPPGSGVFDYLAQPVSLQQLLGIISKFSSDAPGAHHSISITGGEPLLSADILEKWLPALQALLPVHLETNGTMPDALEQVIRYVDYISMDMKLPSTSGCAESLWDAHRLFLQAARSRTVSVKVVIGGGTTMDEICHVCEIIESVDRNIPLFLQPLTLGHGAIPDQGSAGITPGQIMRLQESASARLPDVRVIPQMHLLLGAL